MNYQTELKVFLIIAKQTTYHHKDFGKKFSTKQL